MERLDLIKKEKGLFNEIFSELCNSEADKFALSLLMPTKLVKEAWKLFKNRENVDGVQECAKIFKVSVSTMCIRLEDLNLISGEQKLGIGTQILNALMFCSLKRR